MAAHEQPAQWVQNRADGRDHRGTWSELRGYGDLIRYLALRDLRLRYRQAALGVLWVVFQPLTLVAGLYLVFGRVTHVSTFGAPYPLFALAGLLTWNYFSMTLLLGSEALVAAPSLVTKVYIPRLAAPVAALLPPLVDLGVTLLLFAVMCGCYGILPRETLVALPLWMLLLMAIALGSALWLAAINVRYRDVRNGVGPLLQALFFISPIAYSGLALHGWERLVYAANPLVGTIELARYALLGGAWPGAVVGVSAVAAAVLLVTGRIYFRRAERSFADVI